METSAADHASQNGIDVLDSPQARLSLLDKFDAVSPYLPPGGPGLNKATLWHWDLRTPNIFVEDGRITCLIDWQDAWIGPLFMQERRPQLIEYCGETILRLPDHYEAMEVKEEKAKLTDKVERSILHWYYGRETQRKNTTLQELFDLPLARTRRETVLFASEVWDGETIPLRECPYHLWRLVCFLEAPSHRTTTWLMRGSDIGTTSALAFHVLSALPARRLQPTTWRQRTGTARPTSGPRWMGLSVETGIPR